jgi:ribose transport system ATP-binding protein
MEADLQKSIIELNGICKSFHGVEVLQNISISIKRGEVHILCGENGAGKSTLMKILAGLYRMDRGTILIDGKKAEITSSNEARKQGIAMVPQELDLCPTISVCENIFLAREYGKFFVNRQKMRSEAKKYMDLLGLKTDPNRILGELPIAEQQMVIIAKALSQQARILVMDEPCSSLTEEESERLFGLLITLKSKGVGIIYIDHRIDNFMKIGDRISILRDGKLVGTLDISEATKEAIIQMMVGRKITEQFPKYSVPAKEVKLRVRNISNSKIRDISFDVYKGEVFGLAGLVGSGRSEIIRAIFGVDRTEAKSEILLNGERLKLMNPRVAIRKGIAYVPEDRKLQSLVMHKTLYFNISLVNLESISKGIFLSDKAVERMSQEQISELQIKVIDKRAPIAEMSGGNQQKIALGRWLMAQKLEVFLLDEPTRGVDVGVKQEIYRIINDLAGRGISIILVTSELPELIGLCDRIAVVNDSRIKTILDRREFSQHRIMDLCV